MILDRVAGLVASLRRAGVEVSLADTLDATEALRHVDMAERSQLREALAATTVKHADDRPIFDDLFDVWFASVASTGADRDGSADHGDLQAALAEALASGDDRLLAEVARRAVARVVAREPGRPGGAAYRLFAALGELNADGGPVGPGLEYLLARRQQQDGVERLRRHVEAEIRRRRVVELGTVAAAAAIRRVRPSEVDFLSATPAELAALRRALHPLARRMASRVARQRRSSRRGGLDLRRSVRRSMSSGGVVVDPSFRRRRFTKPEIFLVADVSGSVAGFARFTVALVHAFAGQFSRVRSFVFVDEMHEVTSLFRRDTGLDDAIAQLSARGDGVGVVGHSDYGRALETFRQCWWRDVTARSTVVILGDARSNYHPGGADVVAALHRRCRRLYWLNPEPRSCWDTGDSVMAQYASHCDGVFECRNLRQLEAAVGTMA